MTKSEIIELIERIRITPGIKLQLNQIDKDVLYEVAAHYNLTVFSPEKHPLEFFFAKGYYDSEGNIRNEKKYHCEPKKTAVGSFSLTTNSDFPEMIQIV